MHGLKSFVCKLKKKATFPHPSVPDNDVFEEIGVRPIFFEPRIIYFWMVGHAEMEKQWRKKNKKSRRHVVSRRGVVGDQEKGTSASNFYIFLNKHHRCFFSHRKRKHTKGNMAGNTTWHRHAWGLAATIKPPQCRKNGAYMVINFHFFNSELVFAWIGFI